MKRRARMKRLLCGAAVLAALGPSVPAVASPHGKVVDILVFTETTAFRHDSISDGVTFFHRLAAHDEVKGVDFTATVVNDSTGHFTDKALAPFEVIVFLSATGNPLNTTEQDAMQRFIQHGGGFVGIHAASDNEYTWPWYGDLVGAYFNEHPNGTPRGTIHVEDRHNISTRHLPALWTRIDEWYSFRHNPRKYVCNTEPEVAGIETQDALEPVPGPPHPVSAIVPGREVPLPPNDSRPQKCGVHVLMTLDDTSYDPSAAKSTGPGSPGDHPIAWCHNFDGGRSFYTALGHTAEAWVEPAFGKHLVGGLLIAAGAAACESSAKNKPV